MPRRFIGDATAGTSRMRRPSIPKTSGSVTAATAKRFRGLPFAPVGKDTKSNCMLLEKR